jgi:hypothetical protein
MQRNRSANRVQAHCHTYHEDKLSEQMCQQNSKNLVGMLLASQECRFERLNSTFQQGIRCKN